MDPYSKVDYSRITPEAGMVMKKASGDDSLSLELKAGCREELLDPPDLGMTMAAACSMFRGKMFVQF
jgi:hypothetical protein